MRAALAALAATEAEQETPGSRTSSSGGAAAGGSDDGTLRLQEPEPEPEPPADLLEGFFGGADATEAAAAAAAAAAAVELASDDVDVDPWCGTLILVCVFCSGACLGKSSLPFDTSRNEGCVCFVQGVAEPGRTAIAIIVVDSGRCRRRSRRRRPRRGAS